MAICRASLALLKGLPRESEFVFHQQVDPHLGPPRKLVSVESVQSQSGISLGGDRADFADLWLAFGLWLRLFRLGRFLRLGQVVR
jgi:hypothetical protein